VPAEKLEDEKYMLSWLEGKLHDFSCFDWSWKGNFTSVFFLCDIQYCNIPGPVVIMNHIFLII
jgi:hypothetical protein